MTRNVFRLFFLLTTAVALFASFVSTGCKKKEPVVLEFYCSETFWEVMWEQGSVFKYIYGVRIEMVPILPKPTESQAQPETETIRDESQPAPTRRIPAPWRSRPKIRSVMAGEPIAPDQRISGLIASFDSNDRYADLYLTDSQQQLELLRSYALTSREYPLCYLTLVLLVPAGNPRAVRSVDDLLDRNLRLGLTAPSRDGMGGAAWNLLAKNPRIGSGPFPDTVQIFDYQSDLLQAIEDEAIDAALAWDAVAQKASDYAEIVRLEETSPGSGGESTGESPPENQTIRLPLVSLRVSSREPYSRRFADFLISSKGREIFRKHGFVAP